jgi:hypothetical protein
VVLRGATIQKSKGELRARRFEMTELCLGARAELSTPPGLKRYFLAFFFLVAFFAFFAFFAFLAIVSSQGFNGLNATPRHAWRRANLATSSRTSSTDSRRDAACCRGTVITLSTAVMRFDAVFIQNAVASAVRVGGVVLNAIQTRLAVFFINLKPRGADYLFAVSVR